MNDEPTNNQRASWAKEAILAHVGSRGDTPDTEEVTGVVDLLSDLMHLCDEAGLDFDKALETARCHYEAETWTDSPAAMDPLEFAELVAAGNTDAERLEEIARAVVQRVREVNHG